MRSIRTPLLVKQFEQASFYLNNTEVDMIWLEDTDLGLYGLNDKDKIIG